MADEKPVYYNPDELRKYGQALKNLVFGVDTAYGFSQAINITPGNLEWGQIVEKRFKLTIEGGQNMAGLQGSLFALSGILGKTGDEIFDLIARYQTSEDLNKGDAARLWDLVNGIAKYDPDVKTVMPPDAGAPPGPGTPPPM